MKAAVNCRKAYQESPFFSLIFGDLRSVLEGENVIPRWRKGAFLRRFTVNFVLKMILLVVLGLVSLETTGGQKAAARSGHPAFRVFFSQAGRGKEFTS